MSLEHRAPDWESYRMDYRAPFRELEPVEREIAVVNDALQVLVAARALPNERYDHAKLAAHRRAVQDRFEIPWSAISPRMLRLLYAINAVHQPAILIAAGVFCGNTFVSNAGAAVGPGACYEARELIGIEIRPAEAARAERNVRTLDPTGVARVVTGDAVPFCRAFTRPIDLLYLDADGDRDRGKGIYLEILESCYGRLPAGALVLAHNSVNGGPQLDRYLAFVRDPHHFRESVNVVLDPEGLEVSLR
ncbi:hypothetical protein HQ590_13195 [bacterium]|nr:hypothetical protein [bacterium]